METHRVPGVLLVAAAVLPLLACASGGWAQPDPTHVQLTFLGNVREGAVSPDGKTMAYVEGELNQDDRLYVQDLVGGEPVELARSQDLFHLRWSPNGEALLVGASVDGQGGRVLLIPRVEGATREFPFARWFAMSPDAHAFAFAYYDPGFLFIRDLSSSRVDTLALPGSFDVLLDLDWSPQGDRIAFVVHEEPSRFEVWVIEQAGDSPRSVVRDSVPLFNPRWSRDGEAIYYTRDADASSKDLYKVEVPAAGEAASPPSAITHLGPAVNFELVREDDEVSYIRSDNRASLFLISIDGAGSLAVRQLTTGSGYDSEPALSPDGRRVAFTRTADGRQEVHVLDVDTGSSRPIASLGDRSCCPAWSPDGAEIAFFSGRSEPRIWKVPSRGGNPTPLTEVRAGRLWTLHWAAGSILIQDLWDSELHRIDAESGQELPLAVNETLPWMQSPRLSPDGARLAGSTGSKLLIVSLAGERPVELQTGSTETVLGWSADGDHVYTYALDSSRILRHSTSGSGVEIVAETDCGTIASMSSDATRFVCVSLELRLDLWVVRGFQP